MDITRFGHAAVLVDSADSRILIDPGNFSSDEVFALTGLQAIVVTHQHPDHVDQDRIDRLVEANPNAQLLAEPQTAEKLRETGARWSDLNVGDSAYVGGVTLTAVGGQHAEIHADLPQIGNVGVLLAADGEPTLFHPGDSYATAPEGVDVLAVPLGAPWAKVGETIDFVRAVSPKALFPVHDRTIAEIAYPMYWGRAAEAVEGVDARKLGQTESSSFSA